MSNDMTHKDAKAEFEYWDRSLGRKSKMTVLKNSSLYSSEAVSLMY